MTVTLRKLLAFEKMLCLSLWYLKTRVDMQHVELCKLLSPANHPAKLVDTQLDKSSTTTKIFKKFT